MSFMFTRSRRDRFARCIDTGVAEGTGLLKKKIPLASYEFSDEATNASLATTVGCKSQGSDGVRPISYTTFAQLRSRQHSRGKSTHSSTVLSTVNGRTAGWCDLGQERRCVSVRSGALREFLVELNEGAPLDR